MSLSPLESFITYKADTKSQCGAYSIDIPPLNKGERYRFHFDASACVGCHCCEAACNEQNGNPSNVKWRRVGEMESGEFPNVKTLFNSMSCNHCVDPACLNGCPTNSYIKFENGIVFHDDDECIGCRYCTWNCPYEVPVFNPDRGIVTKCHMCHEKLSNKETPACVQACPAGAIAIEVVNENEWITNGLKKEGVAPHLPDINITKPTTRYTHSEESLNVKPANERFLKPAHAETPLVFMTVLTQVSLGAFVALFFGEALSVFGFSLARADTILALAALIPALIGLPLSALHLGRPIFAHRAIRNLKTSWLSREALFLGVFAALGSLSALLLFLEAPLLLRLLAESGALATGVYGIYAQSMIYRVAARPSWNTPLTTASFFGSANVGLLLIAATLFVFGEWRSGVALYAFALCVGVFSIGALREDMGRYAALKEGAPNYYELERTKRLLNDRFCSLKLFRIAALPFFAVVLPLLIIVASEAGAYTSATILSICALLGSFVCELVGRYLFFVSVVPTGLAGNFFAANQRG